jgi:hypothetical protein
MLFNCSDWSYCLSSSQITAAVHRPFLYRANNYLFPYCIDLFILLLCTPVFHVVSNVPFLCFIWPPWPIYCLYLPYLTSFAHIVYRVIFLLCLCNSVLLYVSNCFALSWPGGSCKWQLVLNLPTWLKKGEINWNPKCLPFEMTCWDGPSFCGGHFMQHLRPSGGHSAIWPINDPHHSRNSIIRRFVIGLWRKVQYNICTSLSPLYA